MFNTLDLLKAQAKKYFKKVPKGVDKKTGRVKYRYYYKEHHGGGVTAVEDLKAGAAFKLKDPSTGKAGHFHVQSVDGDKVTVKHDESDREVTMTKAEFKALIMREHGQALKETAKKRRETYEKMKRENPKHIGLKAAKNRVEKLEHMAGVEKKKPEPAQDKSQQAQDDMTAPPADLKDRTNSINRLTAKMLKVQSALSKDKLAKDELKMPKAERAKLTKLHKEIKARLTDLNIYDFQHEVIRNHVIEQAKSTGKLDLKNLPQPNKKGRAMFEQVLEDVKTKGIDWLVHGEAKEEPKATGESEKTKSADNFETMPESKEPAQEVKPAQEPQIPSKAQLTNLLSSLDELLKAKPELKNDPRIVGLLGTESKPTVDTDKRNSKVMLTLDGKNRKENVTYRIVEAGDAIASHEPVGFSKREEYPEGVQERKYHSDKAEMMKVIRNAQAFDPVYLINTNPDATNGPPIITPEGIVLGGNSRVMSTQRVYANHPESAAAYKEYLTKQADTFGFSAEEVSKFKAPLLVREYKPETETKDHLAKLVRTLNESKTQGIDERQLGLATAVKIRDGRTLGALKIALKESGFDNVENLMTKPSPALNRFKEALFADGVLTNENMNEMIRTHDGTLNGRGRDFIKSMLVGYVVRDSDLLEGLSIGTINHLSTAISKLASAGINEHTRLAMQDAIEIYHHAVGRDKLKRGQTPQQRDAHMNDIMLSEQELFNTKPKENETMEERRQREQGARFAKAKERVSADPLSSSFLKLLTLSVGTKKLGQQMDKMLKLTEDTGVFDMFAGNTKISFGEAARKLSKELSDEFDIEDKLYQLKKALDLLTLLKAIR